jgi:polysaccharide biosynthesis/export protein
MKIGNEDTWSVPGPKIRENIMKAFLLAIWAVVVAGMAMAQSDYVVRPGDTLRIEVLEDTALNRNVIVLPDGRFSFPFAGTVQARGRTLGQIEAAVRSAIGSNFAAPPNVFASIVSLREEPARAASTPRAPAPDPTISVFFLGEVASPGGKAVPPGTTFLQALALGGGFSNFAALKRVQIRRTNPFTGAQTLYQVNYSALSKGAELRGNIVLQDGDVILVPQRRLFE